MTISAHWAFDPAGLQGRHCIHGDNDCGDRYIGRHAARRTAHADRQQPSAPGWRGECRANAAVLECGPKAAPNAEVCSGFPAYRESRIQVIRRLRVMLDVEKLKSEIAKEHLAKK